MTGHKYLTYVDYRPPVAGMGCIYLGVVGGMEKTSLCEEN
jgi:hypothetical protein